MARGSAVVVDDTHPRGTLSCARPPTADAAVETMSVGVAPGCWVSFSASASAAARMSGWAHRGPPWGGTDDISTHQS